MYLVLSCTVIRELKQRRRRRQQERPNNFARASRFFVPFFAVVARLQRESAWIPICGGQEYETTTFFSFPELWYSPLEFNSKNICQHLTK